MICQMSCQCGSQKLIKVLMFHELTACLSVFDLFLTSELLPYFLNDVHEYRFTNVRGFHSNFVDCESFLGSNFPDILTVCKTNLDDSIDPGNFSVRGYLHLI